MYCSRLILTNEPNIIKKYIHKNDGSLIIQNTFHLVMNIKANIDLVMNNCVQFVTI